MNVDERDGKIDVLLVDFALVQVPLPLFDIDSIFLPVAFRGNGRIGCECIPPLFCHHGICERRLAGGEPRRYSDFTQGRLRRPGTVQRFLPSSKRHLIRRPQSTRGEEELPTSILADVFEVWRGNGPSVLHWRGHPGVCESNNQRHGPHLGGRHNHKLRVFEASG